VALPSVIEKSQERLLYRENRKLSPLGPGLRRDDE